MPAGVCLSVLVGQRSLKPNITEKADVLGITGCVETQMVNILKDTLG